jgi:hypothetical protein
LTTDFDRGRDHGLDGSLFTLFPVRQFGATSNRRIIFWVGEGKSAP